MNVEAVRAALPTNIMANLSSTTVPITEWLDTDYYNSAVAGSYTFTAVLGAIPVGYANDGGLTVTVEVIVVPETYTSGDGKYEYQLSGAGVIITKYLSTDTDVTIDTVDGKTVIGIGAGAFRDKFLTSVTLPTSITSIGTSAFNNNMLTIITIPDNVILESFAFIGNQLTIIEIGTGVTINDNLLNNQNDFRQAYITGGAGTYYGTQSGFWTN